MSSSSRQDDAIPPRLSSGYEMQVMRRGANGGCFETAQVVWVAAPDSHYRLLFSQPSRAATTIQLHDKRIRFTATQQQMSYYLLTTAHAKRWDISGGK